MTTPLPSLPQSPRHDDLRAHLLELYARLVSVPVPPDQLIGRFFRLRRNLPPGARGFLAATVYSLLRKRWRTLLLWQWANQPPGQPRFPSLAQGEVPAADPAFPRPVEEGALALYRWMVEDLAAVPELAATTTLAALKEYDARTLPEGEFPYPQRGEPDARLAAFREAFAADPNLAYAPDEERQAARFSLPSAMLGRWQERFGTDRANRLAESLGQPAPLDIRLNRIRGTREELREKLRAAEMEAAPAPYSPDGLRMEQKGNVFRTDLFEEGWFEVQDEASQLVSFALDPRPNWKVLDACSGGGGKSLHMGALMQGKGQVIAHDLDEKRLDAQRKRLKRTGLSNVRVIEPGQAEKFGPYDAVLIDAPCLGLGTLRRNPDLAWRGALGLRLEEIPQLQRACLDSYATLLKPGGVLLYATCSFEPEETTDLISEWLSEHPDFAPSDMGPRLAYHGIPELPLEAGGHQMTLLPSEHGTDGFFLARLTRKRG